MNFSFSEISSQNLTWSFNSTSALGESFVANDSDWNWVRQTVFKVIEIADIYVFNANGAYDISYSTPS